MEKIKITKMQGCGNDFVIIEREEYNKTNIPMSELAKRICDRNFGVGADGMIIPKFGEENVDISWDFYNSDGTTAQMCGNGMRCFARYVTDRNYINKPVFSVKTGAGIIKPEVLADKTVRVNMSSPVLESEKIPCKLKTGDKIKVLDKEFEINPVSMGNPHCVIFTEDDVLKSAKKYGPVIEKHEAFPEKTNVEFVKVLSKDETDFCVYERGCGITLACGTGACASVVAGINNGLLNSKVKVNLLGGQLTVEWKDKKDVYLTGPAEYVFEAEYFLD